MQEDGVDEKDEAKKNVNSKKHVIELRNKFLRIEIDINQGAAGVKAHRAEQGESAVEASD